ncbi:MarR family transcriptional regulator [Streptomyces sp. 184]|uniref:MarR family transcriptional regulator n=1 Tax=Streptomyces sp. 184 TaxID=1827526 RepID=UPI00389129ED
MGPADMPGESPRRPLHQDGDPDRYEPETLGVSADGRVETALRVAQQYYLQRATMGAIAKELGTSRSTVSRLLGYARDTGLVESTSTAPRRGWAWWSGGCGSSSASGPTWPASRPPPPTSSGWS